MPPAILKGWIDRVLRMEIAYRFVANDKGEGVPVGLLKARSAIVFNTANTPDDRERETFGDPLESLWKKCVFDLCGVRERPSPDVFGRHHQHAAATRRMAAGCCENRRSCYYPPDYAARNFYEHGFSNCRLRRHCAGPAPNPGAGGRRNRPGAEK